MNVLPLHSDIQSYIKKKGLTKKFEKQKGMFELNPFHPGLETELLEPKHMRIWSFRIDRKYRALFIFRTKDTIEIVDVNNHYR